VRAVLPRHPLEIHEAHIRLVDERSGLQRLTGPLPLHVATGNSLQLLVHKGNQLGKRRLLARLPGEQELRRCLGTASDDPILWMEVNGGEDFCPIWA
jgi:hypothetical protein